MEQEEGQDSGWSWEPEEEERKVQEVQGALEAGAAKTLWVTSDSKALAGDADTTKHKHSPMGKATLTPAVATEGNE